MASQFVRADSANLPNVDIVMIIEYMKTSDKYNDAELRGVKAMMSSRDSYIDNAVGFVEVKRDKNLCTVKARVVPEHRVALKPYKVQTEIDVESEKIIDAICEDCPAAAGGCKHSLVMLFWLQKRSDEPSSTSTQSYWNKPALNHLQHHYVTTEDVFPTVKKMKRDPKNPIILKIFIKHCNNTGNAKDSLIYMYSVPPTEAVSYFIFNLLLSYHSQTDDTCYENFKAFCNMVLTDTIKEDIENKTRSQVDNIYWHNIRQGHITASKIHDVAHCKTSDGTLVQEILGGYKLIETKAMKRGKQLEIKVIKELEKSFKKKINQAGFFIHNAIFGASSDGIFEDNKYIVEIKCPTKITTVKYYITNNKITEKCMAQVQLQMLATNIKKCLFCVADINFEINNKITVIFVDFDEVYIQNLLSKAEAFYKKDIYPKIVKSVLK